MEPGKIYIHDRHQLAVLHERSGYVALAPRDAVLCARPDEIRTGFTTSFFSRVTPALLRTSVLPTVFSPRGEIRAEPCAEEIAWRDAVVETLDALVAMSDRDRYFANLQAMWRGPDQATL